MAAGRKNGNGGIHIQDFMKAQLEEAQKRFNTFEQDAERLLKNLITKGREQRRQLEGVFQKLNGDWLENPTVRQLGRRAGEAGAEAKKRFDQLQTKVVQAVGVATQNQVQQITRELSKLSKKVDSLVGKRSGRSESRP